MKVKIRYGRNGLSFDSRGLPVEVLASRIDDMQIPSGVSGRDIVRAAMDCPIGSPTLRELAKGCRTCTLIISDHTRPVPSRDILPEMLRELREGNPDISITLLAATGCHRLTTADELREKVGGEIFDRERIEVHDCERNNVKIGVLPSGADLVVDRLVAESDLVCAEGFIEPHFFAGFSGGRKSILPGVCDKRTVMGNHCSAFLADDRATAGVLDGNPIHTDMKAAARMARLRYIVNVILDGGHRTAAAFAGDAVEAHRRGCGELMRWCGVRAERAGDIVISSNGGAPLDQNLYQAVKGIVTADGVAAEGGVIIMCAECADGSGSDAFYAALRDCAGPRELLERVLKVPQLETPVDQWQYQLLVKVLVKHRVIFVTRPELASMVREMKMDYAPDIDTAIAMARADVGEGAHIVALPDGISVIPQRS